MDVLRSEGFIKALLGVIATVLVAVWPETQRYLDVILPAIAALWVLWFAEPAIQGFAANQKAQADSHTAQAQAVRSGRG